MVKTSIEQNLRNKNFGAKNGNFQTSAVVKNRRVKQREQRSLGNCWQWKANGSVQEETIAVSVTISIIRAKMTQPNSSPNSFIRQNERNASITRSPRKESQWENVSIAMQGLP